MKKRTKLLLALSAALCLSFGMATFAACGDNNDPPADHTQHVDVDPQDGKCDVCGDDMPAPAEKTYTVTFNSNGGSTVNAVTVKEGEKAKRPTDPTKQDKNFGGWYTDAACSDGKEYNFDAAVTGNITLYAKWTDKTVEKTTWTVTFDTGEGSKVDPQEVAKNNGRASKPATDPTRTGYRFDGWYAESNCEHAFNFSNRITADTTIYAKWVKVNTVTFDTGDGASKVQAQVLDEGVKPTEPETEPTKEGYIFKGWYTAAEDGEEFDFDADLTGDVTVYAHWEEDTGYYNQDGWLVREGKLVSYTGDKSNIVIPNALEEFDCISQLLGAMQNSDKSYQPTSPIQMKNVKLESEGGSHFKIENSALWSKDGKILYAFWDLTATEFICETEVEIRNSAFWIADVLGEKNTKFKLEYIKVNAIKIGDFAFGDFNNNYPPLKYVTLTNENLSEIGKQAFYNMGNLLAVEVHATTPPKCGENAFKNANNFTSKIYVPDTSVSVYKSASGWSTYVENDQIVGLSTRTYTVTFDAGEDASTVQPKTVKRGQTLTAPAAPTKAGYTFDKWYKDAEHEQEFNFRTDVVNEDITLYAGWTEASTYTLTYDLGDGDTTTLPAQTVNVGENPTKPANPKKESKKFVGWYTKSESEGWGDEYKFDSPLSSDTTIYAKWETCEHKDGFSFDYTKDNFPKPAAEGGSLTAKCAECGAEQSVAYAQGFENVAEQASKTSELSKGGGTYYATTSQQATLQGGYSYIAHAYIGFIVSQAGEYKLSFTDILPNGDLRSLCSLWITDTAYGTQETRSSALIYSGKPSTKVDSETKLAAFDIQYDDYDKSGKSLKALNSITFNVTQENINTYGGAAKTLYIKIGLVWWEDGKVINDRSIPFLINFTQPTASEAVSAPAEVAILPGKQNY